MNGPLGGRRRRQVAQSAAETPAAVTARLLGVSRAPEAVHGVPDNEARTCWRSDCRHLWHGLACRNSLCPCETSWVDPDRLKASA